jgi:hypothetical protein
VNAAHFYLGQFAVLLRENFLGLFANFDQQKPYITVRGFCGAKKIAAKEKTPETEAARNLTRNS